MDFLHRHLRLPRSYLGWRLPRRRWVQRTPMVKTSASTRSIVLTEMRTIGTMLRVKLALTVNARLIIPCRPNLPDHPSNGGFIRSHPTVCCISFSLVSPRHLILKLVISRMKKTSLSITCMAQDSIPVVIHPCNRSLIPSRLPTKTVPSLDPLDPLPNKENACQPPPPARTQPRSSLVGLVIHAILQEGIRLRGRQDQMAFRLSMNSVRVSTQTPLGLQYPQSVCVEFVAFLRRSRSYCRSNEQI
ncbi:hypothetical protein EV361DRAFT_941689 [Lentinula raphanica]|nr:hypothetical protein EV361DRAFT_941689 [Lentinula raphanica]